MRQKKTLLTERLEAQGYEGDRISGSYKQLRNKLLSIAENSENLSESEASIAREKISEIESLYRQLQRKEQSINICNFYIKATNNWIEFGKNAYQDIKERTRDLSFYIKIHLRNLELADRLSQNITEAYSLLNGHFKNLVDTSRNYFSVMQEYNGKKVLSENTLLTLEGKLDSIKTGSNNLGKETIEKFDKIISKNKEMEQAYVN